MRTVVSPATPSAAAAWQIVQTSIRYRRPDSAQSSLMVAKEHFDTLPAYKQQALREQEERGELGIMPQAEMRLGSAK